MLLNCPECGHEVSDRAKNCPNCGYPFQEESSEETGNRSSGHSGSPALRIITFIIKLLLVLVLLIGVLFLAVRMDAFGLAMRLRELAETDAGDGSHGDDSVSRIAVKYYIIRFLDTVNGIPPEKQKEPVAVPKISEPEPKVKIPEKTKINEMPSPPELPEKH